MADVHEKWCASWPPREGACDCREKHPAHQIPREPSAAEVLTAYYPPGVPRPARVRDYLKEHPCP